ncbi:MAG TPA: hypothetical protein VFO16_10685 [Pseudonocardiaceae bacterium]|nr:hypothetical protein [Pseudonocardiaceae bacterium]
MTAQLPPASNHDDGYPWSRAGSPGTLAPELHSGEGVRPGESDPARMLAAVLVLVVLTIVVALTLVWWLA